jgi:hypothetical protein
MEVLFLDIPEVRVCTEALPVAATTSDSTKRTSNGKQSDVDALLVVFRAHSIAEAAHKRAVERRTDNHLCRERRNELLTSDTGRSVGEAGDLLAVVNNIVLVIVATHHSGGTPRRSILGVFPTQAPLWPFVMLTFSSMVICDTRSRALA